MTIQKGTIFERKFIISGPPKYGLHLLDLLVRPLAQPMPQDKRWMTPWIGNRRGHSFTDTQSYSPLVTFRIGRVQDGQFLKGHLTWSPDLATFMYALGIIHIFIVRDPRDAAVSLAYHIQNHNAHDFPHPAKELLQNRTIPQILEAVIMGIEAPDGRWCPGIMARWEEYAPWMDEGWTHTVRFEDYHEDPQKMAAGIIHYMMERVKSIFDLQGAEIEPAALDAMTNHMLETARQTHLSLTFRKGARGDWREFFDNRLKNYFKGEDINGWLVRLGYEKDEDW